MMWQRILASAVEEVRVVFKSLVEVWMGWSMKGFLDPAGKRGFGLGCFEVEMPVGREENWAVIEEEARGKAYRLTGVFRSGERRVCGSPGVGV